MTELKTPVAGPDDATMDAWRAYALEYLAHELREAAPTTLSEATLFPRSPLDGEGAVVVFAFEAVRSERDAKQFYVVVGRTEPNYYPSQGLSADEAFSLHLGTRFMLVMGIAQAAEPMITAYDPARDARTIVDRISPNAPIEDARIAAAFDVDGQLHTVVACRLAGRDVFVMAGDAPHGIHERTGLPPQVAYRLHIGQVLRNEPDPDQTHRPKTPHG